jgi:hypothetical protein
VTTTVPIKFGFCNKNKSLYIKFQQIKMFIWAISQNFWKFVYLLQLWAIQF